MSDFRQRCVTLLEKLPEKGIVVTKRGRAIARILPVTKNHADLIGSLAGQFEIRGDILSSADERQS